MDQNQNVNAQVKGKIFKTPGWALAHYNSSPEEASSASPGVDAPPPAASGWVFACEAMGASVEGAVCWVLLPDLRVPVAGLLRLELLLLELELLLLELELLLL
jgi:hypothetical protein